MVITRIRFSPLILILRSSLFPRELGKRAAVNSLVFSRFLQALLHTGQGFRIFVEPRLRGRDGLSRQFHLLERLAIRPAQHTAFGNDRRYIFRRSYIERRVADAYAVGS